MKFHHINTINESESEDDPFADPNPSDLKKYLGKLRAQAKRRLKVYRWLTVEWQIINTNLCTITGEKAALWPCVWLSDLRPSWTRIGAWQISPGVISNPSLHNILDDLNTEKYVSSASRDLTQTIERVKLQIKLAKNAK